MRLSKESEDGDVEFSEKLMTLRRRAGLSQEQLADRLGVTRQSVSKWEGGAAMPELGKLVALADLFGVTLDDLVRDEREAPEPGAAQPMSPRQAERLEKKLDALASDYRRSWGPYFRYTSKARIFGLPLVSVRFGRDRHPSGNTLAVGVIAVGNFSVGVVSVGLISAGVFSLGMISLGLLTLGMISLGYLAFGLTAVGVYAAGAAASGLRVAVGAAASGSTAVGREAAGTYVLQGTGFGREAVEAFLAAQHPDMPRLLLRVLSFAASCLK